MFLTVKTLSTKCFKKEKIKSMPLNLDPAKRNIEIFITITCKLQRQVCWSNFFSFNFQISVVLFFLINWSIRCILWSRDVHWFLQYRTDFSYSKERNALEKHIRMYFVKLPTCVLENISWGFGRCWTLRGSVCSLRLRFCPG